MENLLTVKKYLISYRLKHWQVIKNILLKTNWERSIGLSWTLNLWVKQSFKDTFIHLELIDGVLKLLALQLKIYFYNQHYSFYKCIKLSYVSNYLIHVYSFIDTIS